MERHLSSTVSGHCHPLFCQLSSQIKQYSDEQNTVLARMPAQAKGSGDGVPGRAKGMSTGPKVHTNVRLRIKGSHFSAELVEPDAESWPKLRPFFRRTF